MKRWMVLSLVVCVMFGMTILTLSAATAQDEAAEEPLEYVGDSACEKCHEDRHAAFESSAHMQTLNSTRRNIDDVVADFSQGEEVRMVQFPDEDAPRPFTADDIAYVVGSGRYAQRFLYRIDRGDHAVLPAEWDVEAQQWQPFILAENWPDPAYDWEDTCAGCHTTGLNAERDDWEDDGVTCEACHGPGSAHNKLAARADKPPTDEQLQEIRANIATAPDAQICGQCHSRGLAPDGAPYPAGYLPGHDLLDPEVFALVEAADAGAWWAAGHEMQPTAQLNQWYRSQHAGIALEDVKGSDYAEDSCLRCHSQDYRYNAALIAAHESGARAGLPPEPVTVESAVYAVTCQACHDPHLVPPSEDTETEDEASDEAEMADESGADAMPPYNLRAAPYALCVECHNATTPDGLFKVGDHVHHPVQEMFEGYEFLEQVTGIPSQHFTNGVLCADCHMPVAPEGEEGCAVGNHSMQTICPAGGGVDSCSACHTDLSSDYLRQFMNDTQAKTVERVEAAREALAENGDAEDWMYEVLDFVEGDGSQGVHNYAYTDALLYAVELQLGVRSTAAGPAPFAPVVSTNPEACAECHRDEYRLWETSTHGSASLRETFREEFAAQGQPSFCMRCHMSGYDAEAGTYEFESIVCSQCHLVETGAEHPPAPIDIGDEPANCGRCHSGVHSPTYDEWLVSAHDEAGIGCVDCHTPHDNGLRLGDINTTCGDCHQEALIDEVHMGTDENGEPMDCAECHMAPQIIEGAEVLVEASSHTLFIDPSICAACHGNVHLLSVSEEARLEPAARTELDELREQVAAFEAEIQQTWSSGVTGGVFGMLVVAVVVGLVWSRRRRP